MLNTILSLNTADSYQIVYTQSNVSYHLVKKYLMFVLATTSFEKDIPRIR